MGRINYGRVVIGGLVAGVVMNIGEIVLNTQIVMKDWEDAMRAIGKAPMGNAAISVFIVLMFALGLLSIWLYAAIRPRFGPGPKTALCAGLAVWALSYAFPSISGIPMEVFPTRLFVISSIWGLVEAPLATLAGAYFYKED
jgi:hypothetical protein